tara:strand:- start:1917 stop:2375 length:459 start_codon:yes stop_codon:yes gene_type:complete
MKFIAHRGNIDGPNPLKENNPEYIDSAIKLGYDVEIDVRCEEHQFYLGHDDPQYYVPMTWLVKRKDNLWIHCKDLKSLDIFSNSPIDFNYFWHQEDDYTLTSMGYIWTYPGKEVIEKSIMVMPEWNTDIGKLIECKRYFCYGICSDYLFNLK